MAEETRRNVVRLIVPLVILVVGGAIAWLAMSTPRTVNVPKEDRPAAVSGGADAKTGEATKSEAAKADSAKVDAPAAAAAKSDDAPAMSAPAAEAPKTNAAGAPAAVGGGLRVREFDAPAAGYQSAGSIKPKKDGGTYELELRFSPLGAGLELATLANHFTSIKETEHEVIQQFQKVPGNDRLGLTAFAADAVEIDGQRLSLWATTDAGKTYWRETGAGAFEAVIEDANGAAVVKITRVFEVKAGSYEFTVRQGIENVSGAAKKVRFVQFGPKELPLSQVRYGGDVRRARFGYVLPQKLDPSGTVLSGDARFALVTHTDFLGSPTGTDPRSGLGTWVPKTVWPTEETKKKELSLAWAATTSRYFAVAVHAPEGSGGKVLKVGETVERVAIATPADVNSRGPQGVSVMRLTSGEMTVGAGEKADVSVAGYAGPLSKTYIAAEKGGVWAGLESAVIFTFGGPCGFCTFQPVAEFLRWFLGLLHDYVFKDWALAIMFLVVCVRTLLHPVTRWSQTNMLRFGKHMSRLAPKQKAIQEKYADDQTKMREEIARLMREEHVSYASGAMGCVPMFLQMPVWIALYAMLFFTFELRHEHAFYGAIQSATGHKWGFMGDLAEPDHFVSFGTSIWIPLLSSLMGPIEALNILPLVMGVVFYIQQKYMSPPQTAAMTPEMEQQQKIMKVMTVVMFPLFMYNAPSGLALYFLTNSTLGILESKWVRGRAEKLIEEEDRQRELKKAQRKASGKEEPTGWMARIQKMVEERQKMLEQSQKQAKKKK